MKLNQMFAKVGAKINKLKWKCCINECNLNSINSHMLQKNGILSSIAQNGYLIEARIVDPSKFEFPGTPLSFNEIGINQAISLPLFCNLHDTNIFKNIESQEVDFTAYNSHLLLSYRSVCGELRKKQVNKITYEELSNTNELNLSSRFAFYTWAKATDVGIQQLEKIKKYFEDELQNNNQCFYFKSCEYPLIEVYGSAVFSPSDEELGLELDEDLRNVFIHVFPYKNKTYIISGYHKDHKNQWIQDYVESWCDLDSLSLQYKLTDLFSARIESWGMSINQFNHISDKDKKGYLNYIMENSDNLSTSQSQSFNLFSNLNF